MDPRVPASLLRLPSCGALVPECRRGPGPGNWKLLYGGVLRGLCPCVWILPLSVHPWPARSRLSPSIPDPFYPSISSSLCSSFFTLSLSSLLYASVPFSLFLPIYTCFLVTHLFPSILSLPLFPSASSGRGFFSPRCRPAMGLTPKEQTQNWLWGSGVCISLISLGLD